MKLISFFIVILFVCGCVAIVDDSSGSREIKSLIITKKETNDLLERVDEIEPSQKYQIQLFQKEDAEEDAE